MSDVVRRNARLEFPLLRWTPEVYFVAVGIVKLISMDVECKLGGFRSVGIN